MQTEAVKAIIVNNGKFLLLQRNPKLRNEDNWDLPGGLVEPNESDVDALGREVLEEINTPIKVIRPSGKWTFRRPFDGQLVSVKNYFCELVLYQADIVLSEEHISFVWIYPKEIVLYNLKDSSLIQAILVEFQVA